MYIVSRCSNKYFIDVQTCKTHDIHVPGIKDLGDILFCVYVCAMHFEWPRYQRFGYILFCVYVCVISLEHMTLTFNLPLKRINYMFNIAT